MASALQCPACGHKHRLSELTGDPIFSCEQCGRHSRCPTASRKMPPIFPGSRATYTAPPVARRTQAIADSVAVPVIG